MKRFFKAEKVYSDGKTLHVSWNDGHSIYVDALVLRNECPCAKCKGHGGNLQPSGIEPNTQILHTQMQGNYALKITFSDNHDSGIYTWDNIREIARKVAQ